MTNYVNPYMNPYGQYQVQPTQLQSMQQMPQQQVVKVNGEGGARAYQMAPNSSALLLDESGTIVWLKTTDGAGFPTVSPYDITPHAQAQPVELTSLESRITRLEEIVNANTANIKPTKRSKPVDDISTD